MQTNRKLIVLITTSSLFAISLNAKLLGQVSWQGDDATNPTKWGVPGNWSSGLLPTTSDDVVVGAPAPTVIDSTLGAIVAGVSTLEVQADGEIQVADGRKLDVSSGMLTNNGLITVNSNSGASSRIGLLSGGTIDGTGTIVLGEPGNLAELLTITGTIIHEADHTIVGEGQINGATTNNGTITAEDVNGDLDGVLVFTGGGTKTNNSIIQSSATARINFLTDMNQGANGKIIANTSKVILNNRVFTGGTLESTNGGFFESTGNSLRFDGVKLNGMLNMSNPGGTVGTLALLSGGVTNNGTIQLGPDAGGASIVFISSTTIDGTGEIIMNFEGLGARILSNAGFTGTLGANQTVRGVGSIEGSLINDGLIIAEPRQGTILQLINQPKTNNGTIRADLGATLRIRSTTITQNVTNGIILANEGLVELDASGTIVGGRLEAAGVGRFSVRSGASGYLLDVVNNAPFDVSTGNTVLFLGGQSLVNNNTITVNSVTRVEGNVSISGTGEIVLPNAAINSRLEILSGFTATLQPGHLIRGKGQINGPGTLINEGRVEGVSAAEPMEINGRIGGGGVLKDVRIDGTHAPGTSTDIVPLEGEYSINHFAKLEIELGGLTPGTQYDQLNSTGTISLASTSGLNVSFLDLANGYIPAPGDRFDIITSSANNIVGTFGSGQISLPTVGFGRNISWKPIDYSNPLKVTLEIANVSFFDADFDEDGDVDGNDLTRWQANYDTGSTHMQGDADDDGDVDGRDFLIWQRQFGLGLPLTAASRSIPEPGTLSFCSALLCVFGLRPLGRGKRVSSGKMSIWGNLTSI